MIKYTRNVFISICISSNGVFYSLKEDLLHFGLFSFLQCVIGCYAGKDYNPIDPFRGSLSAAHTV